MVTLDFLFNALGIAGGLCFMIAFALLQTERLKSDSYPYLLLNLAGAVLLLISLLWDWNLPAFLLETIWALISIYGLWRRWHKRLDS